jgi:hypothetical protein
MDCGTYPGYRWHVRHGEDPCDDCREARRIYDRARRWNRRQTCPDCGLVMDERSESCFDCARMARKEYCKRGHRRDPDNLRPSGNCRACDRERHVA